MKKITIPLIILFTGILISGSALAFKFASPSDPSAKVVMNHSNSAKQLFPVKLLMVNGENVPVRGDAVWLQPGEYELRFSTQINSNYTKQIMGLKQRRGLESLKNTLKINVEAEKSYYVAYDASSNNTDDWQPVVYKVK
ncbi:hypothetical protein [Marinicella meishanensis]|uniref:hypothetical protein n=1 Tax=Marinicella meishanensis TaxID=2873263 RepID=UPI001CBBF48F|nr:hypothetical protein [Marinicella sp. NBU2979]